MALIQAVAFTFRYCVLLPSSLGHTESQFLRTRTEKNKQRTKNKRTHHYCNFSQMFACRCRTQSAKAGNRQQTIGRLHSAMSFSVQKYRECSESRQVHPFAPQCTNTWLQFSGVAIANARSPLGVRNSKYLSQFWISHNLLRITHSIRPEIVWDIEWILILQNLQFILQIM